MINISQSNHRMGNIVEITWKFHSGNIVAIIDWTPFFRNVLFLDIRMARMTAKLTCEGT